MLVILFIVITTLFIIYVGGFRLTAFGTVALAVWNVAVYMNTASDNNLLFVIWLVFAILSAFDIKATHTNTQSRYYHDKKHTEKYTTYEKRYKKAQDDEMQDADFED